jgi:hypothetical protein
MRFLGRRPRHGREDGAVLVIVVLVIVALFGMVTLAVDVGALLVKRRQLVTAADAAALAAAQSCAHKEGQTAADGMAAGYATFNAGGTITVDPPTYVPGCSHPAGKVTVVVRDRQGTFFAPVLGFADSMPVTARATAIWGGIGSGSFLPFMLSWGKLLNCGFIPGEGQYPQQVQDGTQCTFWMNNRQEEMGASEWATLNLCTITSQAVDQNCKWGWDVPRDYGSNTSTVQGNCSAAPTNDLVNWIQNGSPVLALNYPDPTFVCVGTGAVNRVFDELAKLVGQSRLFPVNDPTGYTDGYLGNLDPPLTNSDPPHGQVNKEGDPCPPPCVSGNGAPGYNGPIDKYDIVGFAWLEIRRVDPGGPPQGNKPDSNMGDEICGQPQDSNGWCLTLAWKGYYTSTEEIEEQGQAFNVLKWWLIE